MIFDKLCRGVERRSPYVPNLTRWMKKAAIFDINAADLPNNDTRTWDEAERLRRAFLPFDEVWIEARNTAVEPGQVKAFGLLLGHEPISPGHDHETVKNDAMMRNPSPGIQTRDPLYMISVTESVYGGYDWIYGYLIVGRVEEESAKVEYCVGMLGCGSIDRDKGMWEADLRAKPLPQNVKESAMSIMAGAGELSVLALEVINSPTNWIVKREHVTARPIERGKIARSDQRPRYILVSHDEIERVIRDPNPANEGVFKDRRPHRRRAHSKLLSSEKFTWKRGQRVHVKACWVGPEQAEYGGERYTVCLDL